MTPLSERAIACIESRLKRIREAGGFHTDVGANVRRSVPVADDSLAVVVWAGEETAGGSANSSAYDIALSVAVVGYVPSGQADTGRKLECLKADIKVAVIRGWSGALVDEAGFIGQVIYTGCTAAPRDDGSNVEAVQCRFAVTYREGLGNPYGQQEATRAV